MLAGDSYTLSSFITKHVSGPVYLLIYILQQSMRYYCLFPGFASVVPYLDLDLDSTLFIPWDDSFREIQVSSSLYKKYKKIKDKHTLGYKIYYIKYARYRKKLNINSELNID